MPKFNGAAVPGSQMAFLQFSVSVSQFASAASIAEKNISAALLHGLNREGTGEALWMIGSHVLLLEALCRSLYRVSRALFRTIRSDKRLLKKAGQSLVKQYQTRLVEEPENTNIWLDLAEAYLDTKDFSLAKTAGERALELDPNSSRALLLTGRAARKIGELDLSKDYLTRLIETYPRFARAWAELARVSVQLGLPDAALQAAEQALRLNPGDISVRQLRNRLVHQGPGL